MGTRHTQDRMRLRTALLAFALLAACGDDTDNVPSNGINLDASTLDGATPTTDAGGTLLDAALGADAGVVVDAGSGASCQGANGCYSCKPTTSVQLLNACAEGCQPFDNTKRLPAGYVPGQLPPLP